MADDHSEIGRYLRDRHEGWSSDNAFRAFTDEIRAQRLEQTRGLSDTFPAQSSGGSTRRVPGPRRLRHRLTPALLEVGGHIGYDVRPSARRRGHATAMLREALIVALGLGIESALVTCNVDNVGSRKVIERNGGVLEDECAGSFGSGCPRADLPPKGALPSCKVRRPSAGRLDGRQRFHPLCCTEGPGTVRYGRSRLFDLD